MGTLQSLAFPEQRERGFRVRRPSTLGCPPVIRTGAGSIDTLFRREDPAFRSEVLQYLANLDEMRTWHCKSASLAFGGIRGTVGAYSRRGRRLSCRYSTEYKLPQREEPRAWTERRFAGFTANARKHRARTGW